MLNPGSSNPAFQSGQIPAAARDLGKLQCDFVHRLLVCTLSAFDLQVGPAAKFNILLCHVWAEAKLANKGGVTKPATLVHLLSLVLPSPCLSVSASTLEVRKLAQKALVKLCGFVPTLFKAHPSLGSSLGKTVCGQREIAAVRRFTSPQREPQPTTWRVSARSIQRAAPPLSSLPKIKNPHGAKRPRCHKLRTERKSNI